MPQGRKFHLVRLRQHSYSGFIETLIEAFIMIKLISSATLLMVFISACGGGGGSSPPTIDIVVGKLEGGVTGMTYSSGSTTGTLTDNDLFMYEVVDGIPQAVVFTIGNIEVATVTGSELLTLLDLVPSGNIDSVELHNIIAFLILLDDDQIFDNGIALSSELIDFLANNDWSTVDFSDPDFINQRAVSMIIADLASIENDGRTLINPSAAGMLLQQDQLCRNSGVYNGTFSGDDNGPFLAAVDILGQVFGIGFSETDQILFAINGSFSLSGSTSSFAAGDTTNGASFSGSINNYTSLDGNWENTFTDDSGTFNGPRLQSDDDEQLRYVLAFTDDTPNDPMGDTLQEFGFIHVSVFNDDSVEATMVNFLNERTLLTGALTDIPETEDNDGLKFLELQSADGTVTLVGGMTITPGAVTAGVPRDYGGLHFNTNTGLANGIFYGFGCQI